MDGLDYSDEDGVWDHYGLSGELSVSAFDGYEAVVLDGDVPLLVHGVELFESRVVSSCLPRSRRLSRPDQVFEPAEHRVLALCVYPLASAGERDTFPIDGLLWSYEEDSGLREDVDFVAAVSDALFLACESA